MREQLEELVKEFGDTRPAFVAGETPILVDGEVVNGDESLNIINAALGDDKVDHLLSIKNKMFAYVGGTHICISGGGISPYLVIIKALGNPSFGSRGIYAGDEIITTATNVGIINAALACGVTPVVLDLDLNTLTPSSVEIEMAIEEGKTKAIFLSSPNGNPIHGETIRNIADEFGVLFIEDVGYGIGGKSSGLPVGDFADVAIYSFYSSLLGEANIIVSKSNLLHDTISAAIDSPDKNSAFLGLGISNLMYGYLDAQLDKIDYYAGMRRENFKRLSKGMEKHSKWIRIQTPNDLPSWSSFLITLREPYEHKFTRLEFMEFLETKKIWSRLFTGNVFSTNSYKDTDYRTVAELMTSDCIHRNSFIIGCHPNMQEVHVNYVIECIDEFMSRINDE